MNAALYALEILKWIQAALAVGGDVKAILDAGSAKLQQFADENRGPTDAEWKEVLDKRHGIEAQIQAAAAGTIGN